MTRPSVATCYCRPVLLRPVLPPLLTDLYRLGSILWGICHTDRAPLWARWAQPCWPSPKRQLTFSRLREYHCHHDNQRHGVHDSDRRCRIFSLVVSRYGGEDMIHGCSTNCLAACLTANLPGDGGDLSGFPGPPYSRLYRDQTFVGGVPSSAGAADDGAGPDLAGSDDRAEPAKPIPDAHPSALRCSTRGVTPPSRANVGDLSGVLPFILIQLLNVGHCHRLAAD